jgi:LysM repeat protein
LKHLLKLQFALVLALCGSAVQAQTLKGSAASIDKQYRAAVSYGFSFVKTASALQSNMSTNRLIRVTPDRYLDLHDVSYPYAVPGTRLFLSRLSQQYYNTCGEKLTVTSLLRPRDRQPANSVAHSVHPTGMAVDLRIPPTPRCRAWLEKTLLTMERNNAVDVTRERYPPHYHVAVFTRPTETQVAALTGATSDITAASDAQDAVHQARVTGVQDTLAKAQQARIAKATSAPQTGSYQRYVVRRGDTLSEIAARTGVRVTQLRAFNNLRGNRIDVGQKLRLPSRGVAGSKQMVASNETTHRVNRGDTLWRIASRYGTSVQQLRRVNGNASDDLQVGQVLKISKG